MDTVLGLCIGFGLSAACGFRVFVPLLGMSIAHMAGHLEFASGFEWIGTWPALIAFATATVLEVCAYYLPWVDNVMDVAATPAAIVAGIIVTASQVGDVSPLMRWSLAVIAGGGAASVIQVGTVASRAASSGTTGGLGNLVVASLELFASVLVTALAIFVPLLCVVVLIGILWKMGMAIFHSRMLKRRQVVAVAPDC